MWLDRCSSPTAMFPLEASKTTIAHVPTRLATAISKAVCSDVCDFKGWT